MKSIKHIATCKGSKVALESFQFFAEEGKVLLKITTFGKDNWTSYYENTFEFEEVSEIAGFPLPSDLDFEDSQALIIYEHEEPLGDIRHFSYYHSEFRAEIHIKAKGFSAKME